MREQLSNLEGQLENLFEGSLANLIGEELSAGTLARQLARTMEDGLRRDDAGHAFAPNEFALTLNPEDASRLVEQAPDIQAVLSRDVAQAAERCGYSLTHQPSITLASDPTLDRREVRVISWHSSNPLEFTKAMEKQPLEGAVQLPEGAFLILGDGFSSFLAG